ncbi:MAG: TylF/MycF/NovP-related O-methyltransferase [Rhizobiaceae bacterium]
MTGDIAEPPIEYRPGLVGRFARILIPMLHRTLPAGAYRVAYDALYNGYRQVLRRSYLFRYAVAQVFGDEDDKLRTKLTRRLLPFTMGGRKALENAFDVVALAERRRIPGALVECGVAEGGTAGMMALASRALGRAPREKWLFDSYEGLPEPTLEDYEGGRTGQFIRPLPRGACLGTIEQVSELMFGNLGLPRDEVHLVKGWFQDTVPAHRTDVGQIAVLRLDGDWYESTKIPLENLYDRVSPGGFVIVDDYATCFGSRRAVDEFRAERGVSAPLLEDGRGGIWFEKPVVREQR